MQYLFLWNTWTLMFFEAWMNSYCNHYLRLTNLHTKNKWIEHDDIFTKHCILTMYLIWTKIERRKVNTYDVIRHSKRPKERHSVLPVIPPVKKCRIPISLTTSKSVGWFFTLFSNISDRTEGQGFNVICKIHRHENLYSDRYSHIQALLHLVNNWNRSHF